MKTPRFFITIGLFSAFAILAGFIHIKNSKTISSLQAKEKQSLTNLTKTKRDLAEAAADLQLLQNEDQYKANQALKKEIDAIVAEYKKTVSIYEKLLDLKDKTKKTDELDKLFAKSLSLLSDRNYASAEATLAKLSTNIDIENQTLVTSFTIPANMVTNNTAPGAGFSRQKVDSDVGSFLVDIIAADLSSTRVVVDTASPSDCHDNCPVLSLGDYAARSGAYAGINGPYFCPASYPSCAGKTNSFDTLLMNKNITYFNSDNNIYSTVPAVIFSGSGARFVGHSSEWGRDTSVDSVIAAQPMLLSGGNVVYGGDDEAKRAGAGSRSFIGTKGNTVYIGVVHNANVAQVARVLKTMGLENALNLDSGGSTALWYGGYKVGPGRATPFGILFVRK
jgi:exopolysaccharide biosynthesis protein